MQFRLFIVALCFLSASLKAQPVFDVFQFQYQYSNPTKLLNKPEGQDAVLNFFQSQLNLPVKISPRDVLVLNPSYERRRINTGSNNLLSPHGPTYKELDVQSLSFTVSNQHTFSDTTATATRSCSHTTLRRHPAVSVREYDYAGVRTAVFEKNKSALCLETGSLLQQGVFRKSLAASCGIRLEDFRPPMVLGDTSALCSDGLHHYSLLAFLHQL
jgi:hypothetical protein